MRRQVSNQTFLDRCWQWLARRPKSLDQICQQIDAEYQIPRPAAAQHLPAFQAAMRLLGVCGEAALLVFCGFISAFLFVKSSHWLAISIWVEIAAHCLWGMFSKVKPKLQAGVLIGLGVACADFSTPNMMAISSPITNLMAARGVRFVNFSELREPSTAIFMIVPEGDAERYKRILSTFFGLAND